MRGAHHKGTGCHRNKFNSCLQLTSAARELIRRILILALTLLRLKTLDKVDDYEEKTGRSSLQERELNGLGTNHTFQTLVASV